MHPTQTTGKGRSACISLREAAVVPSAEKMISFCIPGLSRSLFRICKNLITMN